MELTYDWKNFQSLFNVKKNTLQNDSPLPIYVIVDKKVIISAFSDGEDLSDWVGATPQEMSKELSHRDIMILEREKVDSWIGDSMNLTHYYDQIQFLRSSVKSQLKTHGHFLLDAMQGWWHKTLPTSYGVYIHLEGQGGASLLLIIQRGRLGSFHLPDLSSLPKDRKKFPADIVKYISERYVIPIQGFFLTQEEWFEWSDMGNPWPKIFTTFQTQRAKMVPYSWSLMSLIGSRAYLGL